MNISLKKLTQVIILVFFILPLVLYFIPEFWIDYHDKKIDPLFINDISYFYLLIALPFTLYAILGALIKLYCKKQFVFFLPLIAPVASAIFSSIHFEIFGSAGLMFGAMPVILLFAGIHFLVSLIASIIIYFKG